MISRPAATIAVGSSQDLRLWSSSPIGGTVEEDSHDIAEGGSTTMVFEETVVLNGPFDDVLAATKAALADHGFGVLTEIDMQQTLKAKVGTELDRYVILGACNPALASQALAVEPQVGVLLPCNVVVHEVEGTVHVDALDPGLMVSMTSRDELAPIAAEARSLISGALAALVRG